MTALKAGDIVYFEDTMLGDLRVNIVRMVESDTEGKLRIQDSEELLLGNFEVTSDSLLAEEWIPLWSKCGFFNFKIYREVTE